MRAIARYAHLLGLVLFLGSILAFVVASSVTATGDLAGLAVARRIISAGTAGLTLPGLALLLLSGTAAVAMTPGAARQPRVRVMAGVALLIVVNTVLVVVPAVRSATALAVASATAGHLADGYARSYLRESVAGGGNVLLALVAMAAGARRPGAKSGAKMA